MFGPCLCVQMIVLAEYGGSQAHSQWWNSWSWYTYPRIRGRYKRSAFPHTPG